MTASIPASAFRAQHHGVLVAGEHARPVLFVFDGRSGLPVLPVSSAELESGQVTLCCPDEAPEALHLHCEIDEIADYRGCETCDRWQGHFGRPGYSRWARLKVHSARWGGTMIRLGDLIIPNTLTGLPEARLCRAANALKPALINFIRRSRGTEVSEVLVVGVDQFGIDLRTSATLVRADFGRMVADQADAAGAMSITLGVTIAS